MIRLLGSGHNADSRGQQIAHVDEAYGRGAKSFFSIPVIDSRPDDVSRIPVASRNTPYPVVYGKC